MIKIKRSILVEDNRNLLLIQYKTSQKFNQKPAANFPLFKCNRPFCGKLLNIHFRGIGWNKRIFLAEVYIEHALRMLIDYHATTASLRTCAL